MGAHWQKRSTGRQLCPKGHATDVLHETIPSTSTLDVTSDTTSSSAHPGSISAEVALRRVAVKVGNPERPLAINASLSPAGICAAPVSGKSHSIQALLEP